MIEDMTPIVPTSSPARSAAQRGDAARFPRKLTAGGIAVAAGGLFACDVCGEPAMACAPGSEGEVGDLFRISRGVARRQWCATCWRMSP
jgi:hypothetical protein